jgi:hypothetical protein
MVEYIDPGFSQHVDTVCRFSQHLDNNS